MLLKLKTELKSEYKINHVNKFLFNIAKHVNLFNTNEVLLHIANKRVVERTKEAYCYSCRKSCQYREIEADIPFCRRKNKRVRIPTEEKLNILILNAAHIMTILTVSKETGRRPVELRNLKVADARSLSWNSYITKGMHINPSKD